MTTTESRVRMIVQQYLGHFVDTRMLLGQEDTRFKTYQHVLNWTCERYRNEHNVTVRRDGQVLSAVECGRKARPERG